MAEAEAEAQHPAVCLVPHAVQLYDTIVHETYFQPSPLPGRILLNSARKRTK